MGVITGLTAERMLAIEAASVVDGDVVGDDLFLTKRDGTLINAGNVRGGPGPTGPMGQGLAVVTAQPVLDVGVISQIRAGRQLTPADFTNMGLSAPAGLWNLSNFNDSSGNARNLTNKGSVPLGVGINGIASTAAVLAGSSAQALYIPDAGVADSLRIRTGSWGIWFGGAKRGIQQYLMSKFTATLFSYGIAINGSGQVYAVVSIDGTANTLVLGTSDVVDQRRHFFTATFDGTNVITYLDGKFEATVRLSGAIASVAAPFNIGSRSADASVASTDPYYGMVDEAFVTPDVLSEDQVRNLYAASISHGLGSVPSVVSFAVRRKRRGAPLGVADFPAQPVRLHNFVAGAVTDQGSNNVPTAVQGGLVVPTVAGPDGGKDSALSFPGLGGYYLLSTDAGLPAGLSARSYGIWFKTAVKANQGLIGWGTIGSADAKLVTDGNGNSLFYSGADAVTGPFVADGLWHFGVVVEDNAASDGVKRKLYLDARVVANSTVMNSLTLAGAGRFRMAAVPDGTLPFNGQLSRAFVYSGALTLEQIRKLYDLGSQVLAPSPKDATDHLEAVEATRLLAIFDSIESCDSIDLAVIA